MERFAERREVSECGLDEVTGLLRSRCLEAPIFHFEKAATRLALRRTLKTESQDGGPKSKFYVARPSVIHPVSETGKCA